MRFRQHQDQARSATRRLLLLFLLTLVLTLVAVNAVLALLWSLQTGNLFGYPRWFFKTNSVVAAGFILGGSWLESLQLRKGGAHVAAMVGGRELLTPRDGYEQRLRNVVQEMAIASGLKPPRIFTLPRDDGINAFAAGWEQHDSVIAVTRGALERLDRDELQGVVAHEFSHILHGDARLNMRLIGHVWGLQLVYMLGRDLSDARDARGRRGLLVLVGLGLMAVGSIGWLAGRLLKAAVSRQREFLADASAVQFTRQPSGIGGALRKIAGEVGDGRSDMHSARAEVISHMLLSSHIFAGAGALATHPPLDERIRRIYGRPMRPLPSAVMAVAAGISESQRGLPLNFDTGQAATPRASGSAGLASSFSAATHATAVQSLAPAPAPPAAPPHDGLTVDWPDDLAAGTLAFLVPHAGRDEQDQWRAQWTRLSTPRQDALLAQAWQLPAALRQGAFEQRLTRCAALPMAQRLTLRRQARQIVRADGRLEASEIWHCLLLDHVLELRPQSIVQEPHCLALASCAAAIVRVSQVLAWQRFDGLPGGTDLMDQWHAAMRGALELPAVSLSSNAVSLSGIAIATRQLADVSRMHRPRLMKTWCALAERDPGDAPQNLWDALRTLCILIDTPMPPQLQAQFVPLPASGLAS